MTSLAVILYITIGAGNEIMIGIKTHQVKSSALFIGLSALIFLCRVFNAIASKNYTTYFADLYGVFVLGLLFFMKLIYNY